MELKSRDLTMEPKFRDLTADDIECRPAIVTEKGLTLLLYKDARVDQDILDETVGPMNWQRKHSRDNANCTVEIWDAFKNMWVSKEDTGTESNTEKEKGLASDSFKRACFNWGIGRELYTAPFIWITNSQCSITTDPKTGKFTTKDKFEVARIEIVDKKITFLSILNQKTGEIVYEWERMDYDEKIGKDKLDTLKALKLDKGKATEVLKKFGYEKSTDIKVKDFAKVFTALKEIANEN